MFCQETGEILVKEQMPFNKNPANGLVYIHPYVYVIGGMRVEEDKYSWTKSCEVYNLDNNTWTIL